MVHTVMGWIDNGEEPDYDERERRTHCSCGAFLPKKPTQAGGMQVVGESVAWVDGALRLVEVEEWFDASTDCRRCGKIWGEMELWR